MKLLTYWGYWTTTRVSQPKPWTIDGVLCGDLLRAMVATPGSPKAVAKNQANSRPANGTGTATRKISQDSIQVINVDVRCVCVFGFLYISGLREKELTDLSKLIR